MWKTNAAIALAALIVAASIGCSVVAGECLSAFLFNVIASEGGVTKREGVSYGPLPRQKLDVYAPAQAVEKPVVAMFFYGGGWREGQRETYRFVAAALAARGVVTVVATADNRIGHSAGAYMAALVALDSSYLARFAPGAAAPGGLVGMAGPYAFDPTTWPTTRDIFSRVVNDPDEARPVAFAAATAPPTLLLYGLRDDVVRAENRIKLANALTELGAPVQRIDYPGIGHVGLVTAIGRPLRWRAPVLDDIVRFVDSVSPRESKAASRASEAAR